MITLKLKDHVLKIYSSAFWKHRLIKVSPQQYHDFVFTLDNRVSGFQGKEELVDFLVWQLNRGFK